MFDSPLVFFYNTLIIFATLVIATLFRRRVFFVTVVTIIWMAIGITNGIILIGENDAVYGERPQRYH